MGRSRNKRAKTKKRTDDNALKKTAQEVPIECSGQPSFQPKNDSVILEMGITVASIPKKAKMASSLNRLQFNQSRYWMRERIALKNYRCEARYKAKVRHIQVSFPKIESATDRPDKDSSGIEGRAVTVTCSPPTRINKSSAESEEVFSGEGFSQNEVNHALGFFRKDRLFLLPIHTTFDMKRMLSDKREKPKIVQNDKWSRRSVLSPNYPFISPLRIRFAQMESDLQRRRREQSSYYKQKLINQDQWIPLKVTRTCVADTCTDTRD